MKNKTSNDTKTVPDSPKFDISGLPNKDKEKLIPPLGYTVPVLFDVAIPGQEGQRVAAGGPV
jgi:hypothetical protein